MKIIFDDPWDLAWRLLALAAAAVVSLPLVLLGYPVLRYLRGSTKRMVKAEYRYRRRRRHWEGYEPVWWANKPR